MEKTLIKKEEDLAVISKDEFEKRFTVFKDDLTFVLLGLRDEKSQIDGAKLLSILKKLSSSL